MRVNIGLIIDGSHFQNQQLQQLWGDFPPLVEHFDELAQQIQGGHTILAASDGSYMEDGQASAGWAFCAQSAEADIDGRIISNVKILFRVTILVHSRLDSNSAYQAEAVGVFTVTIVLHFLGLYLQQQQITTSLICDKEGLVKCINKYCEFDMKHITPDMTETDIILPMIHFSKHLNYNIEWHREHVERRKED